MARRALLIAVPGADIHVDLSVERLRSLLDPLGFEIAVCHGQQATRAGILAALDRLNARAGPDDACFIHYFGHGGRIRFTDVEGPHVDTIFGFVSAIKEARAGVFGGVLDIELSARFAALDRICGNVTVMLDCCFSAEIGRAGGAPHFSVPIPATMRNVLAQPLERLALESHPRIVRVCGASAKREAFSGIRMGRTIGLLTEAFVDSLRERSLREVERTSWGLLVHSLRERVIAHTQFEGQWVALAGPRDRGIFCRDSFALPGTLSCSEAEAEGERRRFVRAGWQQGVALGDRLRLLDVMVDDLHRSRVLAHAHVVELEANRARVEVSEILPLTGLEGVTTFPAQLGEPAERMPIIAEPAILERLGPSPWLRVDPSTPAVMLTREPAGLRIEDPLAALAPLVLDDEPSRVLALLEQRARVWLLRRSLAAHQPDPCPLEWTIRRIDGERALEPGAALHAGARIWIELHNPSPAPPHAWFVSVVLIEADGRPRLLNARMPEGLEILPLERERLGRRVGASMQGFSLRWPKGLVGDVAPLRVLVLASRRVIPLAHLVREQASDDDDALALSSLFERERHAGPSVTPACTWAELEFTLQTRVISA